MATVDVLNFKKEKVGSIELAPEVFEIEVKPHVLHSVVRWQLAKRRQGTHNTKTRAFVSGGGRKPFKQKGTGNARQGSNRSPLMPGGAKVFGPLPRSYAYSLPKKMRQLGLKMALSKLNQDGRLFIVDKMDSETGKTKDLFKTLSAFGLNKAVLVDSQLSDMFQRASNNLPHFRYMAVEGLNVYDLLKMDALVLTKDSVAKITERCLPEAAK